MNCQSFENNVTDIARRHPMEAGALEQSLAHADTCPNCARQLEEQQLLSSEFRGLSDHMKRLQVDERIEKGLLEAMRSRRFEPRRSSTGAGKWFGAAAIAAALVIMVGAVGMRLRQIPIAQPPAQVSDLKPVVEPGNSPQVLAIATTPPAVRSVKTVHRTPRIYRRPRTVPEVSVTAKILPPVNTPEITTQFMPLGDMNVANLQDGAQVVRVEMPRYAMARFGLLVNMERYDETVKADVWLGVDGLARAIRFVQ